MAERSPNEVLRAALRVARLIEIEDVRLAMTFFAQPGPETPLDEFHTEWFAATRSCEDGRLVIEAGYRLARHQDEGTDDESAPDTGTPPETEAEDDDDLVLDEEPDEEQILGVAHFLVEYSYTEEPEEADLQAFADHNAILNSWPYWRQHVQVMASAMGLPRMMVPVRRIPLLPNEDT